MAEAPYDPYRPRNEEAGGGGDSRTQALQAVGQ